MILLDQSSISVQEVAELFSGVRFRFGSEMELQDGIEQVLKRSGVGYLREKSLSAKDRPDFLVEGGIAIEIKIQGTLAQALRQIDRYAKHDGVHSILVIGSPIWIGRIPAMVGGKPVQSIRITESLL